MKIGIITHYYKSNNYGGTLQAYALCRVLNEMGFDAEQISYIPKIKEREYQRDCGKKVDFLKFFKPRNYYNYIRGVYNKYFNRRWDKRIIRIRNFQESVPHSPAYYKDTIKEANSVYSTFITGSDQVWNPLWSDCNYFLSFVCGGRKASYAASIGCDLVDESKKELYVKYLSDYYAISVRENSAKKCLESIGVKKPIKWVLDPTLLLTADDWESVISDRRIKKRYLFCYFFGEGTEERKLAIEYAKQHKLKIVTLPYLYEYRVTKSDIRFGDYRLFDVGPEDFISLIKYSECVFTNSFHACVFSGIFKKRFFVFNRSDLNDINSRIYEICGLLGCEDSFCDTSDKMSLDYINNVRFLDYTTKKIKEMAKESKEFLLQILQ